MMEVGGQKKGKDFMTSSDQILSPSCQPCGSDGEHIEAEGYCQTCNEYLCGHCYKGHSRQKISKHHVLLDKSNMPILTPNTDDATELSLCTVICPDHSGKVMEFYCSTHDTVQCGVYAVIKHKSCDIKYIPELKEADNYKESAEYRATVTRLQTLKSDTRKLIEDVWKNMTITENMINVKIDDIEAFQDELMKYVHKQVDLLRQQAAQRKEENYSSKQKLIADLESLQDKIEKNEHNIISLQSERSGLFAASKKAREQASEFGNILKGYQSLNKQTEYTFKTNEDLQRLVSSNGELGTLGQSFQPSNLSLSSVTDKTTTSVSNMKTTVEFTPALVTKLPDIKIKTKEDTQPTCIYGLACLPPNRLLATDYHNKKIKAIDTTSNTIISHLSLSSNPLDITVLPGNQEAAVTMSDKNRIQVISTSGQLSCIRSIPVGGWCWGICSTNSRIIVSFYSPAKVQVIDLTGKVLTTIATDVHGNQLFVNPLYVSVAEEDREEMIFVSDYNTNTVTKLTMQGKVISTYKRDTWNVIYGVKAVGGKQIVVCNLGGQTVDVLEEDKNNVITLLGNKTDGIEVPQALCYCPVQGRLYVASGDGGHLVWVFGMKHKK